MKQLTIILLVSLVALASAKSIDTPYAGSFTGDRIVNGSPAVLGQFPHQASLRTKFRGEYYHKCGGTIINSRWILTSAHCSISRIDKAAVVGTIAGFGSTGGFYSIDGVFIHPEYDYADYHNHRYDIALWHTSEDIVFGKNVQPATLPTVDTPANASLIVSGWGTNRVRCLNWDNEMCISKLSTLILCVCVYFCLNL